MASSASERRRTAEPVRPGDSVDGVHRRLRDLIVDGTYAPNERLTHAELASRLGAGRMSVRQALHRLEGEGLVVSTPNRGVRVAPAAISYAEELYAVRLVVEPPLLAGLAGRLTPAELARMHDALDHMEGVVGAPAAFQVAHRDFHMVAAADYASPFIADLVVRVHEHLFRHQRAYMSRPRVPEDFVAVDRELLRALEAGDGGLVRALYELHLIDMAIGMVLDAEPDHRFGVLLRVALANGIEIDAAPDGRVDRPALVRWQDARTALPGLRTTNVRAS
ncbi:MAG TPA: GntR family transcriptional regulator [Candidatus Tectomicrobia bacterium]|nr:GntR family transcriptional regulator [Candidatus Tectomicrobia bacterium]